MYSMGLVTPGTSTPGSSWNREPGAEGSACMRGCICCKLQVMGLVTPCISTAGSSWENKANRCYDTHRQVPAAGRQRVVAPLAEGAALDIVACDCVAVVNIAITHSRNPLFAWLTSGSACRGDCILHPQGVSSTIVFSPCCAHRTAQRWQQRPRRPARAPRAASASASTQPGGGRAKRGCYCDCCRV